MKVPFVRYLLALLYAVVIFVVGTTIAYVLSGPTHGDFLPFLFGY